MTDEYIRKEDVLKEKRTGTFPNGICMEAKACVTVEYIKSIPPADVAPVVHSRWSDEMERVDTYHPFAGFETDYYHRCLNCGRRGKGFSWNFCPYCGAKMDGKG